VVPKLFKSGKSFKGLVRYLSTDPKANSSERVAWTHTLNLAYDHVPSALDEMIWTARSADWLKRQAGGRTGGSPLKDPVRHYSLNWHRSEQPTREHMIETVDHFMKFMKWEDHQAIIFHHTDKQHLHVHVVVNAVHPETGRALDSRFDRSRAQRWALAYEKENTLFCEQRLVPEDQRVPAPTREAWEKMKQAEQAFERDEAARKARAPDYFGRSAPDSWKAKEWNALRDYQKAERTEFFAGGKQAFRDVRDAVFREVREEFRPKWRTYYNARRDGVSDKRLAEMKADILERQNAELETRRDAACAELREMRDGDYKQILLEQKMQRAELTSRQEGGQRSFALLDPTYSDWFRAEKLGGPTYRPDAKSENEEVEQQFRSAAEDVCKPSPEREDRKAEEREAFEASPHEHHRVRDPANAVADLGLGALGAIATIGEKLFDGFLGGVPPRKTRQHSDQPKPRAEQDGSQARSVERQSRAKDKVAEEAARLEVFWQERRRSRGWRDRD
jgi:hypothetical protein